MKITLVLQKQHLGRMFKYNWLARKRWVIPLDTKVAERLENQGITVEDARDVACGHQPQQATSTGLAEPLKPVVYTLGNENVLIEGLTQASTLLRTIVHSEKVSTLADSPETFVTNAEEIAIKRCIAYAHLFDAEQLRLPKRKHPQKKRWSFPRDYGITYRRRFELTVGGLLNKIETRFGPQTANHRMVVPDCLCRSILTKNGKSLQFEQSVDYLWTSDKKLQPLAPFTQEEKVEFPDMYPMEPTASLIQKRMDLGVPEYPVNGNSKFVHPHTAIAYYSPLEVGNLFGEPVTDSQYYARTLTKAFTVAASRAQQVYGPNVKTLPEPIVIQAIQTDGKEYHFGVIQLNSLDLDQGEPNHFWLAPEKVSLFEVCDYVTGKPTLTGYSSEIFDRLTAFYTNGIQGNLVPHLYYESSIENVTS